MILNEYLNELDKINAEKDKKSVTEAFGDDFYGYKEGTEEADDVLFALQVQYGRPEYSYDDFRKLNLTKDEIEKAINFVKEKGYNKFTYFDEALTEATRTKIKKTIVEEHYHYVLGYDMGDHMVYYSKYNQPGGPFEDELNDDVKCYETEKEASRDVDKVNRAWCSATDMEMDELLEYEGFKPIEIIDGEDELLVPEQSYDEALTEAKKKKKPYDSKSITTGNIAYNLNKFNQRMGTAFPGNDNNNPSTEEAKAAAQAANDAIADGAGEGTSGDASGASAGGEGGAASGCSESLKEDIEYNKENQFVFTPEEQEEYNCDEEGNSNEGFDQYVHCGWCGEVYTTSDCREEATFGYICPRCQDELHYHGGELMFIENLNEDSNNNKYYKDLANTIIEDYFEDWVNLACDMPDEMENYGVDDPKDYARERMQEFADDLEAEVVDMDLDYYDDNSDLIDKKILLKFMTEALKERGYDVTVNTNEALDNKVNLTEAKRYVRRYFIRPQQIFCSNKSEILKSLIDLGNENCSVYTLNNLGDIKDVTKLTNDDIIYYYDDGILYDKNHVKVMDYDLSIKHEEDRKKFSGKPTESDLKSDEYDDRMTKVTVVEDVDWTDSLLDEYYDSGEAIESDQKLYGTDNAVVKCKKYDVVAHCEDEKPVDCNLEKKPLEKPVAGEQVDVKLYESGLGDILPEEILAIWDRVIAYANKVGIPNNNGNFTNYTDQKACIDAVCTEAEKQMLRSVNGKDGKVYSAYNEALTEDFDGSCPYCHSENVDFVDEDKDSVKYICRECGKDFTVINDKDITTRNGFPVNESLTEAKNNKDKYTVAYVEVEDPEHPDFYAANGLKKYHTCKGFATAKAVANRFWNKLNSKKPTAAVFVLPPNETDYTDSVWAKGCNGKVLDKINANGKNFAESLQESKEEVFVELTDEDFLDEALTEEADLTEKHDILTPAELAIFKDCCTSTNKVSELLKNLITSGLGKKDIIWLDHRDYRSWYSPIWVSGYIKKGFVTSYSTQYDLKGGYIILYSREESLWCSYKKDTRATKLTEANRSLFDYFEITIDDLLDHDMHINEYDYDEKYINDNNLYVQDCIINILEISHKITKKVRKYDLDIPVYTFVQEGDNITSWDVRDAAIDTINEFLADYKLVLTKIGPFDRNSWDWIRNPDEEVEESLTEAKKDEDELPPDPEVVKLETHQQLNDLVAGEISTINDYEEVKADIIDKPVEHKDDIINTINHIEDEEKEHIDELSKTVSKIPFGKDTAAPVIEKPATEEKASEEEFVDITDEDLNEALMISDDAEWADVDSYFYITDGKAELKKEHIVAIDALKEIYNFIIKHPKSYDNIRLEWMEVDEDNNEVGPIASIYDKAEMLEHNINIKVKSDWDRAKNVIYCAFKVAAPNNANIKYDVYGKDLNEGVEEINKKPGDATIAKLKDKYPTAITITGDKLNDEFINTLNKDSILIIDEAEKIKHGQGYKTKLNDLGCKVFIINYKNKKLIDEGMLSESDQTLPYDHDHIARPLTDEDFEKEGYEISIGYYEEHDRGSRYISYNEELYADSEVVVSKGYDNKYHLWTVEWGEDGGGGWEGETNETFDTLEELNDALSKIKFDWIDYEPLNPYKFYKSKQTEALEENEFDLTFESYNAYGEKLTEAQDKFTCCICGEESYGYGNNPAPVKEEGRCCDSCNAKFVIPARLEQLRNKKNEELDK